MTRDLTPREREILELISLGLTNQTIADQLGISVRTARTHCATIYLKLGVANRTQAALTHARRAA